MAKGNSDLELLIKMMGQTGSDNDNLALVAIRTANKQVRKLAGSWDELLRGHFTIAADPFEGINFPGFGNGASAPPVAPDRSNLAPWHRTATTTEALTSTTSRLDRQAPSAAESHARPSHRRLQHSPIEAHQQFPRRLP